MRDNLAYSVITGASQGLGRALAFELASRKHNLIIVSLPNEGLSSLADELKQFEIEVYYYEVNLTIQEDLLKFTSWVNDNCQINFLINNAGLGSAIKMQESSLTELDTLIKLNMTAPTLIMHQLLPNLLAYKGKAYILNVSSMAAYSPIPYKTIYPASKRFIHDFSRGLYQELKETNVFVSVVHPGPMRTNKKVISNIEHGGIVANLGVLSTERAAKLTLDKLFKGDASILLGRFNNLLWFLMILIPVRFKLPLLSASFKKQALIFSEEVGAH